MRAAGRARARRYYQRNRDEVLERAKVAGVAYRAANRDRLREADRAYRAANRDAILERRRNSSAEAEAGARWRAANPERVLDYARRTGNRRRARRAQVDARVVTNRDLAQLRRRQAGACAYCGELRPLQLEHVVPIARGGRDAIGNLVLACKRCNCSKRDRLLVEWRYRGRGRELVAA
jgi:5-methylcytosine-specific restriction endonuclease McrA